MLVSSLSMEVKKRWIISLSTDFLCGSSGLLFFCLLKCPLQLECLPNQEKPQNYLEGSLPLPLFGLLGKREIEAILKMWSSRSIGSNLLSIRSLFFWAGGIKNLDKSFIRLFLRRYYGYA